MFLQILISVVISLGIGFLIGLILVRRWNRLQVDAGTAVTTSQQQDPERDKIIKELEERIKKNKELLDEVKKLLDRTDNDSGGGDHYNG